MFISKFKYPVEIKDFLSISLCNINYIILAKVLTNKLKGLLYSFISNQQSTFLSSEYIHDNILISQSSFAFYISKDKNSYIYIKIDLEKTYDKLSYNVILQMLHLVNFSPSLITGEILYFFPFTLHACLMVVHYFFPRSKK